MSISRQQQLAIARHGLYLVPNSRRRVEPAHSSFVYRLAAVAAALFLAMTVC
jgi:hypothetical protein